MKKQHHPNAIPFDPKLSLKLDKATAALEEAQANGDMERITAARTWKRRLEAVIFGSGR